MIKNILNEIKISLSDLAPQLTREKKNRIFNIINPDISEYQILGVKTADNEKLVREIQKKYNPPYEIALEIFRNLSKFNVEEYKFAAFFFLNRYKKDFNEKTPEFFRSEYFSYCHTWSSCDSCCIRVLGLFLAKNPEMARKTIDSWSQDRNQWIKRASLVLHLKIIMVRKEFSEDHVFQKIEQMLPFSSEPYIEKAIGWLLKTCSKYEPDLIFNYLMDNKEKFSRLILRYSSEKLTNKNRQKILMKE
ncbi:MAG: DNA alkylation repair protein [Promethearchaeota archaeon]|nr:MAG: DNA alkylation repair protein [Candidatus Lokiarchaeota archaeon]